MRAIFDVQGLGTFPIWKIPMPYAFLYILKLALEISLIFCVPGKIVYQFKNICFQGKIKIPSFRGSPWICIVTYAHLK